MRIRCTQHRSYHHSRIPDWLAVFVPDRATVLETGASPRRTRLSCGVEDAWKGGRRHPQADRRPRVVSDTKRCSSGSCCNATSPSCHHQLCAPIPAPAVCTENSLRAALPRNPAARALPQRARPFDGASSPRNQHCAALHRTTCPKAATKPWPLAKPSAS